jgi:hypothetical protein
MMLSAYLSFRFLGRAVFASKVEMRLVDSHLSLVLHIVLVMGTNISAVDDGFRSGPLRRFARSYGGAYSTRNCGGGTQLVTSSPRVGCTGWGAEIGEPFWMP